MARCRRVYCSVSPEKRSTSTCGGMGCPATPNLNQPHEPIHHAGGPCPFGLQCIFNAPLILLPAAPFRPCAKTRACCSVPRITGPQLPLVCEMHAAGLRCSPGAVHCTAGHTTACPVLSPSCFIPLSSSLPAPHPCSFALPVPPVHVCLAAATLPCLRCPACLCMPCFLTSHALHTCVHVRKHLLIRQPVLEARRNERGAKECW